jgi:hypothetical protein
MLSKQLEGIIKANIRKEVIFMNLIQKIYEEMTTDDSGDDKQSEILKNEYFHATEDQQKAIDKVFIALCGWSLKTIIEGPEATTAYNPYR